jgi:hypothetical protein
MWRRVKVSRKNERSGLSCNSETLHTRSYETNNVNADERESEREDGQPNSQPIMSVITNDGS